MTCVWDSLIAGVRDADMQRVLALSKHQARSRPELFVNALKRHNRPTPRVRWQGATLREQELSENQEWVRDYNVAAIRGGHDTSASDPFFYLVSDLFGVTIQHAYRGHTIVFEPPTPPRYTIRVCSNSGHMHAC
jgi:hypothetical protein